MNEEEKLNSNSDGKNIGMALKDRKIESLMQGQKIEKILRK